jgi:hypothetical protein
MDGYNSIVYLFSPDLQTLIATFGGRGESDAELLWPNNIKVAESWQMTNDGWIPNIIGDVFVTELWGNNTGIRRYVLGNDIWSPQITFYQRGAPEAFDALYFEWMQSGATESWRKVKHNGITLLEQHDALNLPGNHYQWYYSNDSLEQGYYVFEVRAKSIYDASIDTTVKDSFYVIRSGCGYDSSSWSKNYAEDEFIDITPSGTGRYAILLNQNDRIILMLIDGCGNVVWKRQPSGGYQYGNDIASTPDSCYLVTGAYIQAFTYPTELYIQKINKFGNNGWTLCYGGSGNQRGYAVTPTKDGGAAAAGNNGSNIYVVKTNRWGQVKWSRQIASGCGLDIIEDAKSNLVVLADHKFLGLDSSGQILWEHEHGGGLNKMIQTSDGGYLCAGGLEDGIQFYKWGPSGGPWWSRHFQLSAYYDIVTCIIPTDDGAIVGGYSANISGSDYDFFAAEIDHCGDTIWTKFFADQDTSSTAYSIMDMGDGSIVLAGNAQISGTSLTKVIRFHSPHESETLKTQFDLLDIVRDINMLRKGGNMDISSPDFDFLLRDCLEDKDRILWLIDNYYGKGGPSSRPVDGKY